MVPPPRMPLPLGSPRKSPNRLALHLAAYKNPIGYIRAAQIALSISCLILISTWGVDLEYECATQDENATVTTQTAHITTFRVSEVILSSCDGTNRTLWHANDDATPNVRFFYVITSVITLYSTLISLVYTFSWGYYILNEVYVLIDLALTFLLTIFSLVCSCVWWGGANTIATATSHEIVIQLLSENAAFWDLSPMDFKIDVNHWTLTICVLLLFSVTVLYSMSTFYILRGLIRKLSLEDDMDFK